MDNREHIHLASTTLIKRVKACSARLDWPTRGAVIQVPLAHFQWVSKLKCANDFYSAGQTFFDTSFIFAKIFSWTSIHA